MKFVRKQLLSILGNEGYLKLVSKVYLKMVTNGMLKKQYPELFYLRTALAEGDKCIDIGANLGYYSTMMSKIVGDRGWVYAVEPVPMFRDIWKKNVQMSRKSNLTLFPFALGKQTCKVKMGMPEFEGIAHHGMTKVADSADEKYVQFFDAEMRNPDELFAELDKIAFVKCDVEGYESEVFSNMVNFLNKHKPLVQSELSGQENRKKVIGIFQGLGYTTHLLREGKLVLATQQDIEMAKQDFYFVPHIA